MTILRDPVWQFIGVVLAILVPIVAWWFGARKKEKSFSYEILTDLSLLQIDEEVKNQIKILYQDRIVENLYVIVVKLYNNGRKPILKEEFNEPIQILLPKGYNLLSAEVTDTTPPELKPRIKFSVEPEKITIAPTLLNQDDTITIKILVEAKETLSEAMQQPSELTVDSRIVGVSKINRRDSISRSQRLREGSILRFYIVIWILASGFSLFILTTAGSSADDKKWAQIILASIMTSTIGYLLGKRVTSS